jgi:transcription initiation factor IIE alpha subunit
MAEDLIPDDVERFIVDRIDSVAELEGLLLFRGNPETEWTGEMLAQRLYTNREQAENVLSRLDEQGLLASVMKGDSPAYRYRPGSPELAKIVERVAEVYSKYLIPVTNLIHSKPQSKVQQFADAFKLRKGRDK